MQIGTRYNRITSGHDSLFLPSASLSRLLLVNFTIFRQCLSLSLRVKLGCGDGEGVTGWEYKAVSYMNAQHSNVLTTKSSRGANGSLPYVLQDCVLP
ncbi:hypothetical protein ALC56_12664 [Trachymyrmex septentrionalis]|uniref:Uncharacterized protein n=1 Tax=Trachymyrmex septentrionalis TaxID=34720 RepID=A0A195EXL8_9HYME|nr:hypothetical protein ALC56_12664 [Trachymyrmex septentrionalis]